MGMIKGHEVLTPSGWVDISLIKAGEVIYSYDIDKRVILKETITSKDKYSYENDIYIFQGDEINQVVTVDHKIPYIAKDHSLRYLIAKDFKLGLQNVNFITKDLLIPNDSTLESCLGLDLNIVPDNPYAVLLNIKRSYKLKMNENAKKDMFDIHVPSEFFLIKYKNIISVTGSK